MQRSMNRAKTAFALLVVFFAGCAAAELRPLIVPPARAGTSPQRWEFTCISRGGSGNAEFAQNASVFGAQGWEMVGGAGDHIESTWCFKRPLP
jgi:hypothetical protein